MSVWSVDPGEKNIGFCTWNNNGLLIGKSILTPEEFMAMLLTSSGAVHTIVCEEWAHQPGKTKGGSKATTARVIGWLELYAAQNDINLVMQPPNDLRVWALHAGVELPKGHIPDDDSAFIHGHHYFVDQGILSARMLR